MDTVTETTERTATLPFDAEIAVARELSSLLRETRERMKRDILAETNVTKRSLLRSIGEGKQDAVALVAKRLLSPRALQIFHAS